MLCTQQDLNFLEMGVVSFNHRYGSFDQQFGCSNEKLGLQLVQTYRYMDLSIIDLGLSITEFRIGPSNIFEFEFEYIQNWVFYSVNWVFKCKIGSSNTGMGRSAYRSIRAA